MKSIFAKIKTRKRHIAKTLTWRFIATSDTVLIAFLVSGNLYSGIKIGAIEVISKMILYYIHERAWFKKGISNPETRHILKTFTWRLIGTMDTILISGLILGNFLIGGKIGFIETFTKTILYYLHEKFWYRLNYGLNRFKKLKRIKKKRNG